MSEYQQEKAPPSKTVLNFRDVAGLVENIKPGLLYRSANLGECCLVSAVQRPKLIMALRRRKSRRPRQSS